MAANKFQIPVWDPMLVQWAQNVNARNDANARNRQNDWNRVYDMVSNYGERRRAEEEAEKARTFQSQEAEKARTFQAAENALNRKLQQQNNLAMLNKSKSDNLRQAQAEIGVLDAELKRALSVGGLKDEDKNQITALYNSKKNEVLARRGLDKVENTQIPFKPGYVQEQTTVETPQTNEAETTQTNEPSGEEGKTASQEKYDLEQTKKGFETRKEQIRQMKKGEAKAAAMQQLNDDSKGLVPGFTAEEIKNARYVYKEKYPAGTVLNFKDMSSEDFRELSWDYTFDYDTKTGKISNIKRKKK